MSNLRAIALAAAVIISSGCDNGATPAPPPDITSPPASLGGIVPFPEPIATEDIPTELRCSKEYPSNINVILRHDGVSNLRTACEQCESRGEECWIRDIDPSPRDQWALACLPPGLTGLEASRETEILCQRIVSPLWRQICEDNPLLLPARKVRRRLVCAPAGVGYGPDALQFDYLRCGVPGPLPESLCCGKECDYGRPVVSREVCFCE